MDKAAGWQTLPFSIQFRIFKLSDCLIIANIHVRGFKIGSFHFCYLFCSTTIFFLRLRRSRDTFMQRAYLEMLVFVEGGKLENQEKKF